MLSLIGNPTTIFNYFITLKKGLLCIFTLHPTVKLLNKSNFINVVYIYNG